MKNILLIFSLFLFLYSCQNDAPKEAKSMTLTELDQKIAEKRNQIYNSSSNTMDRTAAAEYIEYVQDYAKRTTDKDIAAKYLFQAGETARSIQKYDVALAIYDDIYENYKNFDKSAQAMFLKAFTLDNDMNQPERAKPIYESFLANHPDDDFADDTQFLLENLGKSDEDIIKSFEKK